MLDIYCKSKIVKDLFISVLAYHLIQNCIYQLKKERVPSQWKTILTWMSTRVRVITRTITDEGKTLYHRSTTKAEGNRPQIKPLAYPVRSSKKPRQSSNFQFAVQNSYNFTLVLIERSIELGLRLHPNQSLRQLNKFRHHLFLEIHKKRYKKLCQCSIMMLLFDSTNPKPALSFLIV